jgi:glycosyltransferase involved in cell wall biosynthesis
MDQEGISHSIRPITHWEDPAVLNVDEQRDWYHSGKVILSCSRSEGGGPSALLEGMAAGCVPVTTLVGSVEEFAIRNVNCVVCEPSPASFIKGIRYALDNIDRIADETRQTIEPWSYGEPGHREKWFFRLFDLMVTGAPPEAFHYAQKHWKML